MDPMRRILLLLVLSVAIMALFLCACSASPADDEAASGAGGETSTDAPQIMTHIRYLAINAGNASPQFGCWEYKLCRACDVKSLRDYIAYWKPDIIMLSEIYSQDQLTGSAMNGPVLPPGYTGICGMSRDRYTGAPAAFDADGASHEHECIAWKESRLSYVEGSAESACGRNDEYGMKNCNYDFTGFGVTLLLSVSEGLNEEITAVAVHPDSGKKECRKEEIARYWSLLAGKGKTVIGGDWNTDKDAELQVPEDFLVNYSKGQHWDIILHEDEYSAEYVLGIKRKLDHAFSNFGIPCTNCGPYYGTPSLPFGSALGGNDGHPRADGGQGMDHRQILADIKFAVDSGAE
ncbi:MAG TPA: hypothetical protein VIS94_15820 [Desulfomonilia bacterium]